jgi:hypothetical protein
MRSPCCLCICLSHVNFWMPGPMCMKLGTQIMAPEPISTAHFINPSRQCLYVYPLSLLDNGSVNTFPGQWRMVGCVVFYVIRGWLVLPRSYCFSLHKLFLFRLFLESLILKSGPAFVQFLYFVFVAAKFVCPVLLAQVCVRKLCQLTARLRQNTVFFY